MRSSLNKRILAYVIDMIIISIIGSIIKNIILDQNLLNSLNSEYNNLNSLLFNKQISFINYLLNFSKITKQIDQNMFIFDLINVGIILIWFVIIPYFNNGQTLGMKIMKIKISKISDEKVSLLDYIYRTLIINGLGYTLISLMCVYLVPSVFYLVIVSFFGIIQFLLVIMSVFMILYNKDQRGIQDIISNTEIIKN